MSAQRVPSLLSNQYYLFSIIYIFRFSASFSFERNRVNPSNYDICCGKLPGLCSAHSIRVSFCGGSRRICAFGFTQFLPCRQCVDHAQDDTSEEKVRWFRLCFPGQVVRNRVGEQRRRFTKIAGDCKGRPCHIRTRICSYTPCVPPYRRMDIGERPRRKFPELLIFPLTRAVFHVKLQ